MSSEVPLYREIFRTLRDEIVAGKYVCSFPSENQLAARFDASRQTVIRTMSELVKAGLIERRRGSGSVVSRKVRQQLGRIGLVVPYFRTQAFDAEVERICRSEGYAFTRGMFTTTPMPREERKQESVRLAHEFARTGVAGVLMQPVQSVPSADEVNAEMLRAFRARGIPVVLIDHDISDRGEHSGCDVVGSDNFNGGLQVGRHLVGCGARHIAFLMHADWAPSVTARMLGVSAAVVEADLNWKRSENVFDCESDDVKGVAAHIRRFRPDAIVCGNDIEAIKLMRTLKKLKIAVPERIMVTGFDDSVASAKTQPTLTTVHQDFTALPWIAATQLFYRIAHPDTPVVTMAIPTRVVVRESTRRAP